ncbi:MAG: isocitrate/isopropylmalate dehydrogenase family protein [Synergistaceae bacterium]|nr:isocitrate/isopropylmalate dehydrogenase family protein [Synergistaceae bacterium]
MSERNIRIAVIPGDGIGIEVTDEAKKVVSAAGKIFGFRVEWADYPFGANHYLATGEVLPESFLEEAKGFDALLLGAIGDPRVKPGILERGILLTLRFAFDQFVNLRPAKAFPKVPLPVDTSGKRFDTVVVRENTEDFYMGIGGVANDGDVTFLLSCGRATYTLSGSVSAATDPPVPMAVQLGIATKPGVERIARYAAETAKKRGENRVTLVTKSNALPQIYGFWEETAAALFSAEYPDLALEKANVDALCYHLVRKPASYGVLLCPNMFGDIVSDLLAGLSGGLGMAAGADIGTGLSMFEPVHGSAPDIAGQGKANPLAAILTAALMLDHLGETEAAAAVERAVENFLADSKPEELPIELGGRASTEEVGLGVIRTLGGERG